MNITIAWHEMSFSGGDIQIAEGRARYLAELAGAVDIVEYHECGANWWIRLLFEWQGYHQAVTYSDRSYNFKEHRYMTIEDVRNDMRALCGYAVHLISLYQIPEGFDRWQNEGGK